MKLNEIRALRGPNYSHSKPLIFMEVDLEEYEEKPSNSVPDLRENLEKMMPSLYQHTCSPGVVGGFFQRVEEGTWPGHIIEHVAIEFQGLAGHDVSYGKTYTKSQKGIYHIVYRYLDERVGLRAGEIAFDLVDQLFQGKLPEVNGYIEELKELSNQYIFGPSTQSILDAAKRRGIATYRLNEYSYVQLGQGKYQRRIEATTADSTSAIGCSIAQDKERTKEILSEHNIPVPYGKATWDLKEGIQLAEEIGYPVVVKPVDGNHGRGVTTNIMDEEVLKEAYRIAQEVSPSVIIEKHLQGYDYRVLVIGGKFVAAALKEPAYVVGDGKHTVRELIDIINEDSNRGHGHEKVLTKIWVDEDTDYVLSKQNLEIDSLVEKDRRVYVRSTANLSTGGTAIDITDKVHSSNRLLVERISRIVNLDIMGVDLLADSLEKPLSEQENAGIIEVNAGPGFRMHLQPSQGQPRDVGKAVVDMLFPPEAHHSIPICAITGTNGKTTTTRLISHILNLSGKVVGMTSTDQVEVNNVPIQIGDYSGPQGALTVLKDQTVDHAVLEVARGGILRRGLGFKQCDVGVLTNVSSDHLGLGGIDTLEELARLKAVVTESVKEDGYAVYNADDKLVVERSHLTPGTPIFFSKDPNNSYLQENLKKGNVNVTLSDGYLVLQKPAGNFEIAKVVEIPITFEGQAVFNTENAMAAVGACYGLGIDEEHIRAGLLGFSPNIGQSPGRMNIYAIGDIKVVLDYGHNVSAAEATGDFFRNMMPGRVIRVSEGTGDRRTEDIIEYGETIAKYSDYHILADVSPRGRDLGETAELMREGLLRGGIPKENIEIIIDEQEAVHKALNMAESGDLVVLQIGDIHQVTDTILEFKDKYMEKVKHIAKEKRKADK